MNERYQDESHHGATRRSAASAKPKSKAAASVIVKSSEKTPQQKKAERKAARKKERDRQRELDAKYYKPDTPRYKKLRALWVVAIVLAIVCIVLSFGMRGILPEALGVVLAIAAYVFIIAAFYIDFSPVKKERQAYQQRMIALEEQQKKAERAARSAERAAKQGHRKKGSGKNASRNPKTQAKAAAENAARKAEEAAAEGAGDGEDAEGTEEKPAKKGLFGKFKK